MQTQRLKLQLKSRQVEPLVGQLDLSQVEEVKSEAWRLDGKTLLCSCPRAGSGAVKDAGTTEGVAMENPAEGEFT